MEKSNLGFNVIASCFKCITKVRLVMAAIILLSVTNQSCAHPMEKKNDAKKKLNSELIVPGDSVKEVLGEENCSVIFSPSKVKLYRLSPEKAGDNDKTIGGYKIEKDMGTIDKTYYSILLYFLSDNAEYLKGSVYPAAPFIPEVAVEFTKKKEVVSIVFSFSGGQLQVVTAGKAQKPVKYYNEQHIMKYFQNIFNDKNWQKILDLK